MANAIVKAKIQDNPGLAKDKKELKKVSQQALTASRNKVGAKRVSIEISDKEWEAIQAGAISENKLKTILDNTDLDKIRERATPRATKTLSTAKVNKAKAMRASGHTTAEIAAALGVSTSTVSNYLN